MPLNAAKLSMVAASWRGAAFQPQSSFPIYTATPDTILLDANTATITMQRAPN